MSAPRSFQTGCYPLLGWGRSSRISVLDHFVCKRSGRHRDRKRRGVNWSLHRLKLIVHFREIEFRDERLVSEIGENLGITLREFCRRRWAERCHPFLELWKCSKWICKVCLLAQVRRLRSTHQWVLCRFLIGQGNGNVLCKGDRRIRSVQRCEGGDAFAASDVERMPLKCSDVSFEHAYC